GDRLPGEAPPRLLERRKVDAPQMTVAVSLERLQHHARGDAAADAGLDDVRRPQVPDRAPGGACERRVSVVAATDVGAAAELGVERRPELLEGRELLARPRGAERLVEPPLPLGVGCNA